jgi:EmrB/QacA subfamily drug resistance transporter
LLFSFGSKLRREYILTMDTKRSTETWVLAATILASSMAFIDGSALNVTLPVIQTSLGASGSQLLWVVNSYLLMLAALILVGGTLGDRLGRKRIFGIGIALFTAASCACGLSPSIGFLIAARLLQGLGGALMIPGSLSLITASISAERRGRAIGSWSAATTLVTVAGPALGGLLSDLGLWRAVFLINLPLGIASLIVLGAKVPESRDEAITGPIDIPGAALATAGLAGLTYGFIEAPGWGFGDARVIAALGLGLLASIVFVLVERSRSAPMLSLKLFASRAFSGANALTLFLYGALSAATFFLSLDLVQVQGYSKTQAGLSFLPFAIILTLMSRWAGGVADRRGPRLFLTLGPSLTALGFLVLAFVGITGGPSAYWTSFFPGIVLFGLGMGLTVAPLTSTVMGALPPRHSGAASGVNNAVARAAGALAIAILGSLALFAFASSLGASTAGLGLDRSARVSLMAASRDLGATLPPPGLAPAIEAEVKSAIASSFVSAFRLVLVCCAVLAFASAISAAIMIKPDKKKT